MRYYMNPDSHVVHDAECHYVRTGFIEIPEEVAEATRLRIHREVEAGSPPFPNIASANGALMWCQFCYNRWRRDCERAFQDWLALTSS